MDRVETVIVGAGLSGLACASTLEKHKKEYLIVEKSNRVGGRVGSIYENDYIFDVGFQVYNTAYKESSRFLDLKNIDLQLFKPGSIIHDGTKFHMVSDPFRDPKNLFSSLFSSLSSFSDKLKVLLLIFELSNYRIENDISLDVTTLDYLKQRKFSEKFIELFFHPFFSGIFLEKDLNTSSKFFKYVFSNFSKGMACIPKNGMQKIPDSIFNNINKKNILFDHALIKVGDSKILSFSNNIDIKADNIVFTGGSEKLIKIKSV
jgi:phytoene dehydrogenase-like protein